MPALGGTNEANIIADHRCRTYRQWLWIRDVQLHKLIGRYRSGVTADM
jgi:hypothetical protein